MSKRFGILSTFFACFSMLGCMSALFKSAEPASALIDDRTVVNTFDHGIKTLGDFSLNTYIDSVNKLTDIMAAEAKPANGIIYIDKEGNITDKSGTSIGVTYKKALTSYFKDTIIPCYYVRDLDTVNNFKTYWDTEVKRFDISFVSDDLEILTAARNAVPVARGILDCSAKTLTKAELGPLVAKAHLAMANTIILSKENATYEFIRYFQARFQTVWIDDCNATNLELIEHINLGPYGLVVKDVPSAIEALKVYNDNSINARYNYTRTPFNVAHRGLCQTHYENSLEGCVAAYEAGATHIEIDVQVTKDNRLAIMHDDTIDRTTDGTGRISDYTAEELKQFHIISTISVKKKGPGVPIPMLDEIFNEFKGKQIVIIVEIKTANAEACRLLKEYVEDADILDQVVVISFYQDQLKKMKAVFPEVPCADLNNYSLGCFENMAFKTLNSNNFVIDTNQSNASSNKFIKQMAVRGYASWLWTYDNDSSLYKAYSSGVTGVTNNMASTAAEFATRLVIPSSIELEEFNEETTVKGEMLNYRNEKVMFNDGQDYDCRVFYMEKVDDSTYKVIFQTTFDTGKKSPRLTLTVFSNVVTVTIKKASSSSEPISSSEITSSSVAPTPSSSSEDPTPTPNNNNNLPIILVSIGGGVGLVLIVALVLILRKKKGV